MLTEARIQTEQLSINYGLGPRSGPPIVLFHGVMRRWQTFLPLCPRLTLCWEVLALDLPGHGRSGPRASDYRVVDYVGDAVEFIKNRVSQPAVLYGHSLGAMVVLAVAAREPSLVRALILEDPPCLTMGGRFRESPLYGFFAGVEELLNDDMKVGELTRSLAELPICVPGNGSKRLGDERDITSLRFTAKCLKHMDPRVLRPILDGRWLEGYDLADVCLAIQCPTLVLQADRKAGGMLSNEEAEDLERLIPDCSRVQVPGGGHLLHWTETETTLRLVSGFLESLED